MQNRHPYTGNLNRLGTVKSRFYIVEMFTVATEHASNAVHACI